MARARIPLFETAQQKIDHHVVPEMRRSGIGGAIRVADSERVRMVYCLPWEVGLFVGGSAGINFSSAVSVAHELGPGHTVVTVLSDEGARDQPRLFNREWLQAHGTSWH